MSPPKTVRLTGLVEDPRTLWAVAPGESQTSARIRNLENLLAERSATREKITGKTKAGTIVQVCSLS